MNRDATPSTRLARIAGVLYLVVAIGAAFSHDLVSARTHVPGDAAATAQSVLANAGLVRLGAVADLAYATAWILLALVLYLMFRNAGESQARALVVLVAVGAGIVCLNGILPVVALVVAADGAYATAFGPTGSNAIVLLLLDVHHYGSLSGAVFMGLWLVPFGYLASASGLFPRALGVGLVAGGAAYLVNVLTSLLVPELAGQMRSFAHLVPTVAEVWMLGYLLARGVRSATPTPRLPSSDATPSPA